MDDAAIDQLLLEADAKLPELRRSSRTVDSRVIVGLGTCGLGRYHGTMRQLVRQAELREWIVDAERRAMQKGRDVGAIAEAQRNALLLAKIAKEDALFLEAEQRKRNKAIEKRRIKEQIEQQKQEMIQARHEAEVIRRRQLDILQYERDVAAMRLQEAREIEAFNTAMLLEQKEEEDMQLEAHRAMIHDSVARTRQHTRELAREQFLSKRNVACAIHEKGRKSEMKRSEQREKTALELRKAAALLREEHAVRVQEAFIHVEEATEQAKAASKAIPNAEAIRKKHERDAEALRQRHAIARRQQRMVRSVSSLL